MLPPLSHLKGVRICVGEANAEIVKEACSQGFKAVRDADESFKFGLSLPTVASVDSSKNNWADKRVVEVANVDALKPNPAYNGVPNAKLVELANRKLEA